MHRIDVTHFSDPGCPFAYSALPALTLLRWRYGEQLRWRHVMIGLTERAEQYERRGYTAAMMAHGYRRFRRYGMPFTVEPRARVLGTGRACRAIVATRLLAPDREWAAYRALQFAWFTTTLTLDEDEGIATALRAVRGLDVAAVMAALGSPDVEAAFQADRAEARRAAGSPTEFQGKAARTDGPVRYTAPSLVFWQGESRLEAGGFQPVEAYDVLIANLDPTLERSDAPREAGEVLARFPDGVTTQEVAAVMRSGNEAADREAAEGALIDLAAARRVRRVALGDEALWHAEGRAA